MGAEKEKEAKPRQFSQVEEGPAWPGAVCSSSASHRPSGAGTRSWSPGHSQSRAQSWELSVN